MNYILSDKSKFFLAHQPTTVLALMKGVTLYENPMEPEGVLYAIVYGKLKKTPFYDVPDKQEVFVWLKTI